MRSPAVPFLMYHDILPEGDPYTITKETFNAQMALLNELHFNCVSVKQFTQLLDLPENNIQKKVCLTFDDGYANNFIFCLPELEKYNFKATFYVTISLIDSRAGFSKDQIRTLSDKGMEIGSHTVNHVFLPNLSEKDLYYELEESKKQLEDIVQKPITSLSLPGGRVNGKIRHAAQNTGYQTICTSVYHTNTSRTDLFSLGRIPIKKAYSIEIFQKIISCDPSVWRSMRSKQNMKFVIQRILGNKLYHSLWKMRYE